MKQLTRILYLTHRWFGVATCLFFVLWFASGMVMMYVEYPELTEEERLDSLPELELATVQVEPEQAVRAAGLPGEPVELRLSSVAGRPAYLLKSGWGGPRTVFADTGEVLREPSEEEILAGVAASGFAGGGAPAHYQGRLDLDQWTVSAGLDAHRPLHKVKVRDGRGTQLYLSGVTGQIVRDTDRAERGWNWVGSTIHWIYPYQLRRNMDLWVEVIIWLSLAGLVSVITGAVIGFMRLRVRKPYRGKNLSPYTGIARWHHIGGLFSLVFVFTFMFSGLMSMAPWGLFASEGSLREQVAGFTGGRGLADWRDYPSLDGAALPRGVKEIEWRQVGGEGHLVLSRSANDRLPWMRGKSVEASQAALEKRIGRAMPGLIPEAAITKVELLTRPDDYYYSRHNRHRPLPVYRVKFADAENTWFHIEQATGAVITRHTDPSRLGRWLYNGLHSLDFSFLTGRGLLWDATMLLLSIAGTLFSATSLILGWRRIT